MTDTRSGGRVATLEEARPSLRPVPLDGPPPTDPLPTKRRRRPGGGAVWTLLVVALVGSTVAFVIRPWHYLLGGTAPQRPQVVASLPVWNLAQGSATIAAHARAISAASPSLFEAGPRGEVVMRPQPAGVSMSDGLATLRRSHVSVVPIISDTRNGDWDPQVVQTILHDPALLAQHVTAITRVVRQEQFAGIDIDYENLTAADRVPFSRFVAKLAVALHAAGKTLTVEVFAKDSEAGYDQRNEAQDYAALGRSADQLRVMAYDWHWQTSSAGPIAPVDWIRGVLTYALSLVPAQKIVLGIPTYGYGWVGANGELVSWLQAYSLSRNHGVPVRWDPVSQSPWMTYTDAQGATHTVWFENTYSIKAKLDIARSYGIGGVYLWLVGDEDSGVWPAVSTFRQHAASTGETK